MCFQQVARSVRKVVDDTTGHTARKQAASANRALQRRAAQTGLVGKRNDNRSVSRMAKAKTRRSRGFKRNIFTSLLGDTSFGKNIKSALKLGQTS